jgi:uncharacterized protein YciI
VCGLCSDFGRISSIGHTVGARTSVSTVFHVLKLTYLQPLDVIAQTRPAHLAWLEEEVGNGRLILTGRQTDNSGGVLITGDIDEAQADDIVASDPYQQAGLVRYERISFNGGIRAPGL